ncbi:MAG: beta galactosidase jelly roll domain-containing protein [Prolixibacteraceae bacterium]
MNTKSIHYYLIFLLLMFCVNSSRASEWSRIADFEGTWSFTIGDNMEWAKVDVDVSQWDRLIVPANWDDFYSGYNGYGWYRKTFNINWMPETGDVAVFLGQIDDVDEVFINGIKVGQSGQFLPDFETAYNVDRRYILPKGILRKSGNVIAVRVYDTSGPGGILGSRKIGIYFDEDFSLLSQNLAGSWKFSTHRDGDVYDINFDDSQWGSLNVPGRWDDQGYANYDGVAWYRTRFTVNSQLMSENELYLVLGKIDDYDKVYLNGDLIARTEYLDKYTRFTKYNAWKLYRVYPIPKSKLKKENVLLVEVRDEQLSGGIYEGPIGIMTKRNAEVILERDSEIFWDNPIHYFLRYLDF